MKVDGGSLVEPVITNYTVRIKIGKRKGLTGNWCKREVGSILPFIYRRGRSHRVLLTVEENVGLEQPPNKVVLF